MHDITVPASEAGFRAGGPNAVIAKKIYVKGDHSCPRGYQFAWHGTKEQHVLSILKNGLKASGESLDDGTYIKPPAGHYELGMKFDGIENWAAAVFVSPSVTYASHVCYAGRTLLQAPAVAEESEGMWAVVIRVVLMTLGWVAGRRRYQHTLSGSFSAVSKNAKFFRILVKIVIKFRN